MHTRSTMFRGLAVLAFAATVAAPTAAWAENGRGRGHTSDDGVAELRHQADDTGAQVGDDQGTDDGAAVAPAAAASAPAVPAAAPAPGAVQASALALSIVEGAAPGDWTFAPAQVTTTVGTTLTWTNTGANDHTVTSDDRTTFDSHDLPPNGTFTFTPTAPGTFAYHCAFHAFMKGTLTVT